MLAPVLCAALVVAAAGGGAGKATPCKAPFPLKRHTPALQQALEKKLHAAKLSSLLRRKGLAVAVVDLTRKSHVYYAALNGDEMFYAASLPKISILLTAAELAQAGKLTWTAEHDARLHEMIVASSNPDAAWGGDQVGLKEIERVMRDPRYCLYDELHGGLWVARGYKRSSERNPEPLKDITHAATARQAARFLVLLERGRLVTPQWSERLMGLMSPAKKSHKFVAGLRDRPGVRFLARKSGTWRSYHSDAALIQHNDARYVAVVLCDSKDGERILRSVIGIIDELITRGAHRPRERRVAGKR